MYLRVSNGKVNIKKNIALGKLKRDKPIPSVVSVAVDAGNKVELNGSGIRAVSKIDAKGQVSKFKTFANFKL